MTNRSWDIAGTFPGDSTKLWEIGPADVPGSPPSWSVTRSMLTSGLSAGVEIWTIDNGYMKTWIIPTRGMGIWATEANGERLGWKSPVRGPIHPDHVSLMEPTGIGWLDGFDELMVRCGMESNGSAVFDEQGRLKYPLHGRIANRPAHSLSVEVDVERGTISLSGIVDEFRFHYQKLRLQTTFTTSFSTTSISWHDKVTNFAASAAKMQMLYHINLGEPLLDSGTKLIAPVREVSPHDRYPNDPTLSDYQTYPSSRAADSQQSFFFDLLSNDKSETEVLLQNAVGDRGVSVTFNKQELPWFTQWRSNVESVDGYVTALEPGTNFPNPQSFEERFGRLVLLAAGDSWSTTVTLNWHLDCKSTADVRARIEELQRVCPMRVHRDPAPTWSAKG